MFGLFYLLQNIYFFFMCSYNQSKISHSNVRALSPFYRTSIITFLMIALPRPRQ